MFRVLLAITALIVSATAASPALHKAQAPRAGCLTYEAWQLLDRIEQRFGPVQVISTCRPGARVAGTGRISKHASGNAIDFKAGARKAAIVEWLIATHHKGGTMTYANSDHIHVDIGPRFVKLNHGGKHAKRIKPASGQMAKADKSAAPRSGGSWVTAAFGG